MSAHGRDPVLVLGLVVAGPVEGQVAEEFAVRGEDAYAAVYLASPEAAFVHGSVIDVDGGRTGVAVFAAM